MRRALPGAALACPYCSTPIGFDNKGTLIKAATGTPLLRYSRAELEKKMQADGAPPGTTLPQWALGYQFDRPRTHPPLVNYLFAEQATSNETVP